MIRCTLCRGEFSEADVVTVSHCPACGAETLPMWTEDDVEVTINWHELFVLSVWAGYWAALIEEAYPEGRKAVEAIAHQLEEQHPERESLTLRQPQSRSTWGMAEELIN